MSRPAAAMSAERNQPLLTVADEPPLEPAPRVARRILALVPALLISRISWVGMKVTDTALLGHVSTHALSASALSDLWTSATSVFIQGREPGDLVGNAIGEGPPRIAGQWSAGSYGCCALVARPGTRVCRGTGACMCRRGVSRPFMQPPRPRRAPTATSRGAAA